MYFILFLRSCLFTSRLYFIWYLFYPTLFTTRSQFHQSNCLRSRAWSEDSRSFPALLTAAASTQREEESFKLVSLERLTPWNGLNDSTILCSIRVRFSSLTRFTANLHTCMLKWRKSNFTRDKLVMLRELTVTVYTNFQYTCTINIIFVKRRGLGFKPWENYSKSVCVVLIWFTVYA